MDVKTQIDVKRQIDRHIGLVFKKKKSSIIQEHSYKTGREQEENRKRT